MNTPQIRKKPTRHLRASDLRAFALLGTQASTAVTAIAEGVNQSVWSSLGAPSGASTARTRGLTGLIFKSITGVTELIGSSVAYALLKLEPWLRQLEDSSAETPERAAVMAALNGVMGDRLQQSANPLATTMSLRSQGTVLNGLNVPDTSQVTGRLLLLVHGLCMNDLQWNRQQEGVAVNHASAVAERLGYTPIYLRYNSGLHVSENGAELSRQLEDLLQWWPQPVTEISVLAHSMGGLVTRSAVHTAECHGQLWRQRLKSIVFLGTPHHGAPLERAGNWVDVLLGSTPYSRPFAKLGQLRSAGITDLRYGLLLDSDWHGQDRFRRQPDRRTPLPLPANVACFTVAASTAPESGLLAERLFGDGLVPLHSALGQHDQPGRWLDFAPERQHLAYRTNHMQLLSSPAITRQIITWLSL